MYVYSHIKRMHFDWDINFFDIFWRILSALKSYQTYEAWPYLSDAMVIFRCSDVLSCLVLFQLRTLLFTHFTCRQMHPLYVTIHIYKSEAMHYGSLSKLPCVCQCQLFQELPCPLLSFWYSTSQLEGNFCKVYFFTVLPISSSTWIQF